MRSKSLLLLLCFGEWKRRTKSLEFHTHSKQGNGDCPTTISFCGNFPTFEIKMRQASKCLKIIQKVSFLKIASKESYIVWPQMTSVASTGLYWPPWPQMASSTSVQPNCIWIFAPKINFCMKIKMRHFEWFLTTVHKTEALHPIKEWSEEDKKSLYFLLSV